MATRNTSSTGVSPQQFRDALAAFAREVEEIPGQARNLLAVTLEGHIKENWPVDTGFSRAAWRVSPSPVEDGDTGGEAPPVFPDDPSAPVYVGCGADYAQFIEYGTRFMAPRLIATLAVQRVEQEADGLFARLIAAEGKGK